MKHQTYDDYYTDPNVVYMNLLKTIISNGRPNHVHGANIIELIGMSTCIDMRQPIITTPSRKLNYKMMAAEAYMILKGSDKLSDIHPYTTCMDKYSDDGVHLFGAYGPAIMRQMPYIVDKLADDSHTRQAGLTIWKESPPNSTKNVPCTVSMFFSVYEHHLNMFMNLRGSDAWLGFPYDIFSASCVAWYICGCMTTLGAAYTPGFMYIYANTSHLYEEHIFKAKELLRLGERKNICIDYKVDGALWLNTNTLMDWLKANREKTTWVSEMRSSLPSAEMTTQVVSR
jgi:thymidylate synthase